VPSSGTAEKPSRRAAIASHRGGALLWPENGLQAFRATCRLPVEQAECDVHASRDGEPVVIHDATLERTTEGHGPVVGLSAAALARMRLRGGGGETVPHLAEVLGVLRASSVAPRVEIKADAEGRPYPGLVGRVVAELDRAGLRSRAWIIGFAAPTMAEAAAQGGLAGVAWLVGREVWQSLGIRGVIAVATAHGFPEVGMHEAMLEPELLAALRAAGLGVSVWGADHAPAIRRMLGLGVDLLATDDPPLALALREGTDALPAR
jgi:glycerophosphoryl diester phosphodiesterase